jgi:diguanylate cyclase (GGDEF)-like protein
MTESQPLAMVIEDERDIAELYKAVLDLVGFRTELFANGIDAKRRLKTVEPDIILLDLQLAPVPGVSGTEILTWIRSSERFAATKVMVITAHAHLIEDLQAQGDADLVLLKPVSVAQLRHLVTRLHGSGKQINTDGPYDKLTGLYDQSYITDRLQLNLDRFKLGDYRFAILYLEIDDFEDIRRLWGKDFADLMLIEAAQCLHACVRPGDPQARVPEDKFVVLLENIQKPENALAVARRVQELMKLHFTERRKDVKISTSLGVVNQIQDYPSPAEALRDARLAMKMARSVGGWGCVVSGEKSANHA